MRKMRLLYIFPRTTPDLAAREEEHRRRLGILARAASPGTTIDLRELAGAPPAIESIRDEYAVAPGIIEMAQRFEDSYDAMIVGCFGDPAVDGAIEGTRIPIVGCALPSMAASLMLGQQFAVLSPTQSSAAHLRTLVMGFGLLPRFAGAVPVGLGVREFSLDPERSLARTEHAARLALDRGADVLILGCLSLAFTDVGDQLQERLGVPVVNPLRVAVGTCEMLVNARLRPSARFAGTNAADAALATAP